MPTDESKNIGKFVIKRCYAFLRESNPNRTLVNTSIHELWEIVAYDYIHKKYIARNLNGDYLSYIPSDTMMRTKVEMFNSIEMEKEEFTRIIHLIHAAKEKCATQNYKNELRWLPYRYFKVKDQSEVEKSLHKYKNAKKSEKGMRRLEKRFHFFFSENAEEFKAFLDKNKPKFIEENANFLQYCNNKIKDLDRLQNMLETNLEIYHYPT